MNPPFSNGDDHILKAWDFIHDGEIVCLLNAETIKNPHTAKRKRLAKLIENHGRITARLMEVISQSNFEGEPIRHSPEARGYDWNDQLNEQL